MRIKKITIKGLFGIFDHEIPLNMDERITIIHGPNGYGKTMLLKIINWFFESRFREIRAIPFGQIIINFDNTGKIRIEKERVATKPRKKAETLIIKYTKKGVKEKVFSYPTPKDRDKQVRYMFPQRIFDRYVPGLERTSSRHWIYEPTQEILDEEDVWGRFSEYIPPRYRIREVEPWLKKITKAVTVKFIESQRLLNVPTTRHSREYTREIPQVQMAVNEYSKQLVRHIEKTLAEYASLSQKLDSTFPRRVIEEREEAHIVMQDQDKEWKQLFDELGNIEKKRLRIIEAGLLDSGEETRILPQRISSSEINVLSVYISDIKKKLSVFDTLTQKIELFKNNINTRFKFKNMVIDKNEGFIFTTEKGKRLKPEKLSSGEQHQLVLFYDLLFNVKKDSLVLIDEPEISLHIAWQKKFLNDLLEMTKSSNFDTIIATHSPQIISDRWDLTVQLKAPEK